MGYPPNELLASILALASARTLEDVTAVVRRHARRLTGADGVTFVLRDDGRCYYADEDAIAPLWKGKRFPMSACISGWVMQNRSAVVIEDIYADSRIPHEAYRPTFVKSLAMVPVRSEDPIGAIGAYWGYSRRAAEGELMVLQVLADFASVALKNVELIQEIQSQEARYRAIVEDQTELIVRWSPDGTRTFVNEAYCRLLGRSRDELLGGDLLSSIYEPDRAAFRRKIAALRPERPSGTDQRRSVLPGGATIWTEWVDRALFDEQGRIREYQSVGRDIAERVALEMQLRQAQKMDAIGRLAGGVAHDFNNLLTVISGHSELTLETLTADHPARPDLEEIRRAAARGASLTRRLLAVSRGQALEPELVDLNRIVAGAEKMLRHLVDKPIDLVTRLDAELGTVWADAAQLEQVIMNLSVNARDAMPEGGRLTIETRNVELSEDTAGCRIDVNPGGYVMLAVSDTGSGMSQETQSHLFEPFFTTKEKGRGTGLGLSIVFGIVKQSRGSIYVYSEPGAGTTIKIYLPRVEAAVRPPDRGAAISPDDPAAMHGETVLLVEDDDSLRNLAVGVLERAGYRVRVAETAEEARLVFDQEGVDLLITDMGLPGIRGSELASELLSAKPGLPVVVISGNSESAWSGHRSVGSVFLEKPFSGEDLLREVRQALRLSPARGSRA